MNKNNYPHTTYTYKGLQRTLLCLILMCFITKKMNAQQFNNWYFPNNNGISFNAIPPSIITTSIIGSDYFSCAAISDRNGNLLFYSNGRKVWNRNNQLMPNGFGLKGGNCQINRLLIVPFLNDTSKYYLFTSQGLTIGTAQPDTLRYSYSLVDMNMDGGLGDVTSKNLDIRGFAAEKMVAIPNANGTDIWWICRN